MNITIVGLGLIGASYAKGLNKKHKVYGVDIDEETIKYAIDNKIVSNASNNLLDFIEDTDLLVLALYPTSIVPFLEKYNKSFKENLVITDVIGVKSSYLEKAYEAAKPAKYIACHPMAGREKVGIKYADEKVFNNANFLICDYHNEKREIDLMKEIATELGFARISVVTKEKHDKMIGFTSQLTHAIAVSIVNSDSFEDTNKFIGDSYRDLTRIAMINENLWSELFIENKKYLLSEIDNFEFELNKLKNAIKNDDIESLKEIFRNSKEKRRKMEK